MNDTAAASYDESPNDPNAPRKTSPALIAFAWLFVGIPLAWGVTQTGIKSMDLFRAPHAQPGASASPAPAPAAPNAPGPPARSP